LSSKQNNVHTLLADFVEYCLVNDCQPEEKKTLSAKKKNSYFQLNHQVFVARDCQLDLCDIVCFGACKNTLYIYL
jgi:hypothetical protein